MVALPVQALIFGFISALSLPLGAVIGLFMAPVPERTTARFMAFGSGALVFAVATQLYGETLTRLQAAMDPKCFSVSSREPSKAAHFRNLMVQIIFGVLGAILYTALNKWLEKFAGGDATPAEDVEESMELPRSATQTAAGGAGGMGRTLSRAERTRTGSWVGRTASLGDPLAEGPQLFMTRQASHHEQRMPAPQPVPEGSNRGQQIALSMWLGVTLDGIPEALMLGFMTNEGQVSWDLLVAVFIANFPEAFSAASLLRGYNVKASTIVGMWTMVFVLTGVLAMVGSAIMPSDVSKNSQLERIRDVGTAACEGLTGGAMLAMVSTAMVPEAYHHAGDLSGILFVMGFLVSIFLDGLGVAYGGPQSLNS